MYKDIIDTIGFVESYDPELGAAMQRELGRQRQNIELIASENIVSPAVMAAMGSVLTNKYAEGYPGHRYYGGCQYVDQVEQIAIDRACKLFGAKYANVQPHSGAQANLAVYFALLNVGDTVMGMDLSQGGHLTHGSPVNMSGKNYNFVSYCICCPRRETATGVFYRRPSFPPPSISLTASPWWTKRRRSAHLCASRRPAPWQTP